MSRSESFLTKSEQTEFQRELVNWNMLLELRLLADKRATLTPRSQGAGRNAVASSPINYGLTMLYEECCNLLADMASLLTKNHGSGWEENLLYIRSHIPALVNHTNFPPLYARFFMLNIRLEKALTRKEEKKLAGNCVNCGKEVYAEPSAVDAWCEHCRTLNDLTTLRAELKNQREQLLKSQTVAGTLKQITIIVNMMNGTQLTSASVHRLLNKRIIRGLNVGRNLYVVDADSLILDEEHQ